MQNDWSLSCFRVDSQLQTIKLTFFVRPAVFIQVNFAQKMVTIRVWMARAWSERGRKLQPLLFIERCFQNCWYFLRNSPRRMILLITFDSKKHERRKFVRISNLNCKNDLYFCDLSLKLVSKFFCWAAECINGSKFSKWNVARDKN